ncbi:MAG: lysophospholipid acyltransferase family protein [Paludibacter sp.]|nr:lysophospholipid acyltransferase family protein [Paludibacter sp.]
MIKAKHHPLVYAFFKYFAKNAIKKHFHQVIIEGEADVNNHSVMLLSNHISWWDGFWALYLNIQRFNKKFHFMMDETELKKRWLFSYSGGFSISGNSRSMFESIQYASDLLKNKKNMVLIYPQGKLHSSHNREIHFKKGIERIQLTEENPAKVVFLVQLTDYFQFRKPTLYLYLREVEKEIHTDKNYEEQYNAFYNACIEQHSKIII